MPFPCFFLRLEKESAILYIMSREKKAIKKPKTKKKTDGNFLDWVNEYDTYSGNNSSLEGLIEKDEITSDEE